MKSNFREAKKKNGAGKAAVLVYFTFTKVDTIGTVDEFATGLRNVVKKPGAQFYTVKYRLASKWCFLTQLDECFYIVQ